MTTAGMKVSWKEVQLDFFLETTWKFAFRALDVQQLMFALTSATLK